MASNMDPAPLIARSKTLINNDLKKICKEEGQVQSGNKAQLQSRVIARMSYTTCPFYPLYPGFPSSPRQSSLTPT